MSTKSDSGMTDVESFDIKPKKRRRASSSRGRYAPRPSIYDIVAGRVTNSGFLPRYRHAQPHDLFSMATPRRPSEGEDPDLSSAHKRPRRHSHSVSRNQFAPTTPYRDIPSYSHDPLTPYNWLFSDVHAPHDDLARSIWGAADWLTDEGGFDKWARSRGVLPPDSVYSKPPDTFPKAKTQSKQPETDLNDSTAALTLGEGKSQVEVRSDDDTEEGEESSFEGGSSLDVVEPKSQTRETWSLPAHEELSGSPLSAQDVTKLPSSDLLKAVHAYASDAYTAVYRPADPPCHECMDETALLAFGILMEEMVSAEVEGREMEFIGRDNTETSEESEDTESTDEPVKPGLARSRSRSVAMHTGDDTGAGGSEPRSNVVVVVPPVSRPGSIPVSTSSDEL